MWHSIKIYRKISDGSKSTPLPHVAARKLRVATPLDIFVYHLTRAIPSGTVDLGVSCGCEKDNACDSERRSTAASAYRHEELRSRG